MQPLSEEDNTSTKSIFAGMQIPGFSPAASLLINRRVFAVARIRPATDMATIEVQLYPVSERYEFLIEEEAFQKRLEQYRQGNITMEQLKPIPVYCPVFD